jgi:Ca2+-binding RTX toxin-like protein
VAGDPNGLTYSLVGAPAGATIDNTGAFNWIPAAGQLGVFPFQVVVNDNTGAGNATATQNVTIRTLGVESGNLIVVGTAGKDAIKIKRGPDVYVPHDMTPTVQVLFNKQLVGTFGLTQGLGVNGGLIAYGLGGADALHAPLSTRRTYLFGGAGDDKVRGGNGPNVLVGGDGDDKLSGGALRDLLIGGLGADKLSGKKGDDILIGGSTGHVTKLLKLVEVMSEWDDSLTDVATRIGHLDGSLPGGSNNGTFLTTTTVLDDDAKDTLVGAGDTDWYFATLAGSTPDLVKGAKPGEEVTPLA